MKVAITGSSGFIGSHLVKKLSREGIEFKTFDRSKHSFNDGKSLADFVNNRDIIFHLASPVTEDAKVLDLNKNNTKNLLTVIEKNSPECRVIFASSFAVYKLPDNGGIINEQSETLPRNNYGKGKLADEKILRSFSKRANIKALSLRLSNVYGPGSPPYKHSVIASFIDQIKKGQTLTVNGDGTQTRDFVYIDDVIEALFLAAQKETSTDIINICSGEDISITGLIKLLEEVTGQKAKVKYIKSKASNSFWKSDNSLAKKILGWKSTIPLREGLKLTVDSSK